MLTIRIGVNGGDIAIYGAHNTAKKRGKEIKYDLYHYNLDGIRSDEPFGHVYHDPDKGAVVLTKLTMEKIIEGNNL